MQPSRLGWMRMRIDETRRDRLSSEVDFLGSCAGEIQNVRIAADCKKLVPRNRHGLRARIFVIQGQDVAVIENQVRLFLLQRKERKRRKGSKKLPARSPIVHSGPLENARRTLRMLRRLCVNVNARNSTTLACEGLYFSREAAQNFSQGESGLSDTARCMASRACALPPCFRRALASQTQVSSCEASRTSDFWKLSMAFAVSPPNIFGAIKYWRPRLAQTTGLLSFSAMALTFSSLTLGPNLGPKNIAVPRPIFRP